MRKYGDNFRGVGYTKSPEEAAERYALMLGWFGNSTRRLRSSTWGVASAICSTSSNLTTTIGIFDTSDWTSPPNIWTPRGRGIQFQMPLAIDDFISCARDYMARRAA